MKKLKIKEKLLASKKIIRALEATFILTIASNVYARQSNTNPSFYLGADAVYSKIGFKENHGNNIFTKKSSPGLNFFVGHMFNENFGAEIGYEFEKKQKSNGQVTAGNNFAGWRAPAMGGFSFDAELKQTHPYLAVIGNVNIYDNFFVQALVGASVSSIKSKYTWVDSVLNFTDNATFSKTKPVAMVRLSAGYKLTDKCDVRAYATWRNTATIQVKSPDTSRGNLIKAKDTYNVGLGIVYHI